LFDFLTVALPVIAAWVLFMRTRKLSTAIFFGGLLVGAVVVLSLRLHLINKLGLNQFLSETTSFWVVKLAYIVSLISNLGLLAFALSLPKLRKALDHHSSETPDSVPYSDVK